MHNGAAMRDWMLDALLLAFALAGAFVYSRVRVGRRRMRSRRTVTR
jgi:hypothetical protein